MSKQPDLTRFRAAADPAPSEFVLQPVRCAVKDPFRHVLSVDQTLNASGWAMLLWSPAEERIEVALTGMVGVETEKTSHEGNLDQADKIYLVFKDLLDRLRPSLVVHEYPPVSRPGLKIKRPESSLLAASALRHAALDAGVPIHRPISAQAVKVRFTGNSRATKADIKRAVEALDPSIRHRKPMNENVRDAIANGWFAMEGEQS